jgi:hypothetical protein
MLKRICLIAVLALVALFLDVVPQTGQGIALAADSPLVAADVPPATPAPLPAADSPAPDMTVNDWRLVPLIGMGLMFLVWLLRTGKIPLLKSPLLQTRGGGYLLLLALSGIWGVGSSLANGGAVTGAALYQAALAAVMAGFSHNALQDAKGKP